MGKAFLMLFFLSETFCNGLTFGQDRNQFGDSCEVRANRTTNFSAQGMQGSLTCTNEIDSTSQAETRIAKNVSPPPGWEKRTGKIEYHGVSGLDAIIVPDLTGRLSDPLAIQNFLKGSGFHMIIMRYEASKTVPEGTIISQNPGAYKEVKARGPIQVVVSVGHDQDCSEILNRDEQLRNRYQKPGTAVRNICANIRKSQNGAGN